MGNGKKRILLCVAIFLAAGAAVLFYWSGDTGARRDEIIVPRVVKLVRCGNCDGGGGTTYPGRVLPVQYATLFFRVSGPVVMQQLNLGQTVEKGDALMRIDPRDYEREVERLTHELEMQTVQLTLARTEYERQAQLLKTSAVSKAAYDTALAKKQSLEAQLKMLGTLLKVARDKLSDTVLYAPFHGTVTDIRVEENEMAQANVPVMVLQNLRNLKIKVNIPAGNLPRISIYNGTELYMSQNFKVTFPGRGERAFSAKIKEFKPVAAVESETYELLLEMPQPDDFVVLPGMTAEVHGLPNWRKEGNVARVKLPFSAVFHRDGKPAVWVYEPKDGKIRLRSISVSQPVAGDMVTVDGDLKPSDLVVAAGGDWLREGEKVELLNPEALHADN